MIVYRGEKSTKVFYGKTCVVQPCVETDRGGKIAQFGVSIRVEGGGGALWGLVMPHLLITSWRAMKLLEALDEIGNADLCHAYYTAGRDVHKSDQHYLDELLPRLPRGMRKRVLKMVPPDLDKILIQLYARSIDVSAWELQKEIELGLLQPTPFVTQLIHEAEERRRVYMESREIPEKAPEEPKRRRWRLPFLNR